MENLLAFVCESQNELDRIARDTDHSLFHKYYIIVGFEVNKNASFFRQTDSFLMLQSLENKDPELLSRLILLYSMPEYENCLIYLNNALINLDEILDKFSDLKNNTLLDNDYCVGVKRSKCAMSGFGKAVKKYSQLDYGVIIDKAMSGESLDFEAFKIAFLEFLPTTKLSFSNNAKENLSKEIINIVLSHNEKHNGEEIQILLDEEVREKCIVFSTNEKEYEKYTTKISCDENFVVYFYL